MLRVKQLKYCEAFSDFSREWEALESHLTYRTPFTSPIWNKLWWKHFARSGPLRFDEFFVHEVRDEHGKLVAVAPLMRTHEPAVGPLRVRKVQFFGTDPSLTEIRGIICKTDHDSEVYDALFNYFSRSDQNWDVIKWSGLRVGEKAFDVLRQIETYTERILPDYILPLPSSWQELLSGLSNNTRKSIRKGYEFLQRDGHRLALTVPEAPAREDALRRFFDLHSARSAARDMKHHRDNFQRANYRRFLDEVTRELAERKQVHFFELKVNGKIVASRLAFALDHQLYLYFSGYDPDWRKYGIMTTLVVEIIKWAIEGGFTILNLSTGTDQSKLRWLPVQVDLHDLVQSAVSTRGQIALALERWRGRSVPSSGKGNLSVDA